MSGSICAEMMLRKELGAEKVDAAIAEFKQHAAGRSTAVYTAISTDRPVWLDGWRGRAAAADPQGHHRSRPATRPSYAPSGRRRPMALRPRRAYRRPPSCRPASPTCAAHCRAAPAPTPGRSRWTTSWASAPPRGTSQPDRGTCRRHRLVSPRSTPPPGATARVDDGREKAAAGLNGRSGNERSLLS